MKEVCVSYRIVPVPVRSVCRTTAIFISQQTTIMSAKTKRMSAEEKRQAILGIYHSTKEVYTEKEIIALAAKAGVNQNT